MPDPEDDRTPAPDLTPRPGVTDPDDAAATQDYLDLIRSVHDEWTQLGAAGDTSVQLSAKALSTIKESVRADVRHGAHVHMPPTAAGPYTLSELALRTLVRGAVDAVPGVIALRTSFEYEPGQHGVRTRGVPTRILCRISASLEAPDLVHLAQTVREAVRETCWEQVGITPTVDIHIEDVHEN